MFCGKNEHSLTTRETRLLDRARKKIVSAMKVREERPSDFDANLASLKELADIYNYLAPVLIPHANKKLDAEYRSNSSHFQLFRSRAQSKALREGIIMQEAKDYLWDDDVRGYMKDVLAREPRIINLDYSENYLTALNEQGRLLSSKNTKTYKITFSDHSTIILNSLDDESIAQARAQFEEKMQELSHGVESDFESKRLSIAAIPGVLKS